MAIIKPQPADPDSERERRTEEAQNQVALKAILEALQNLTPSQRYRVLQSISVFYEITTTHDAD